MKIKIDIDPNKVFIDTDNIFDYTSDLESSLIIDDNIDKASDDALIEEVLKRKLVFTIVNSLSTKEQEEIRKEFFE